MPLQLRRRNGSVTPFRNSEYIPFYYFIPKSILKKCGAELNAVPRNPREIFSNRKVCEFIESDLFLLLIIDTAVFIAAGLPLTWVSEQKAAFKKYLLQNSAVCFTFRNIDYHIQIVGGGGCLIRNFADFDASRVIINEDICATAKGYEYMALVTLNRNGGVA